MNASTATTAPRFAVELLIGDEWENVSSERLDDNSWVTLTFATRAEAEEDLAFHLAEMSRQCMDFDPADYRIVEVAP